MKIDIKCAACGSNHFELGDAHTDDCAVSCGDCGHLIGSLGLLKRMFADEVLRRAQPEHDDVKCGTSS